MNTESLHELTAAYALDALDGDEEQAYEEHLRTCARCREELVSLREAAGALAHAAPPASPPRALRNRIIEQARAERAERAGAAEGATVVSLRRRWTIPALGAAAAVAASAAIGLGVWAATLHGDLAGARSALSDERAAAAVLADPSAQRSPVAGADGVLTVARDGRAVLALRDIPPAPKGRTYQIWVIRGRTPKPAGLFREAGAVLLARRVPAGATVGVTVERAGGVDAPTEQPRYTASA